MRNKINFVLMVLWLIAWMLFPLIALQLSNPVPMKIIENRKSVQVN